MSARQSVQNIKDIFCKVARHPVTLVTANTVMASVVGVGTGLVSPRVACTTGLGLIAGSIATSVIHHFDR